MATIEPAKPVAMIYEEPEELCIVLPAQQNSAMAILNTIVAMMVTIGCILNVFHLMNGLSAKDGSVLFPIWTALGFAFGLYTWAHVIYMYSGQETIRVLAKRLAICHSVLGLTWNREFDIGQIKRLRVVHEPMPESQWTRDARMLPNPFGNYGPLAFDYGSRTYQFGMCLYESEATDLLPKIQSAIEKWR